METKFSITVKEAHNLLQTHDPKPLLLDVRTAEEVAIVKIPNSLHKPITEIENWIHEIPGKAPILIYCHSGRRSLIATYFLKSHGFKVVLSIDGGINQWALEIDSSLPRY